MGEGDGFLAPVECFSAVRFEWLIRQDVIIKVFLRESIQK